jgi:ribosome-binding protein aMBF1 (putative translation factor)
MSIWYLSIEQHLHAAKCEICGREIEQLSRTGRFARICRSCLIRTPEKRAA